MRLDRLSPASGGTGGSTTQAQHANTISESAYYYHECLALAARCCAQLRAPSQATG